MGAKHANKLKKYISNFELCHEKTYFFNIYKKSKVRISRILAVK